MHVSSLAPVPIFQISYSRSVRRSDDMGNKVEQHSDIASAAADTLSGHTAATAITGGGDSSPGTNSSATSEVATRGNDTQFGRDSERTLGDVDPRDQDDDPDIAAMEEELLRYQTRSPGGRPSAGRPLPQRPPPQLSLSPKSSKPNSRPAAVTSGYQTTAGPKKK
ncbi:hypothetical protein BGW80DRAFT_1306466 [Lactifluus volemus]|nr:hypothetical protein BGW80DRAFT_1306466 [Lactifluus volemus]